MKNSYSGTRCSGRNILGIMLFLGALIKTVFAHDLQVEPVVIEVRPQETFLTIVMKGNGQDIIEAAKVRDDERRPSGGTDSFSPAVRARLETYINAHLQLSQGGQKLRGTLQSLNYWRPDSLDHGISKFDLAMRYPRDASLAKSEFVVSSRLFDYLSNSQGILSLGGVQKTLDPGKTVRFDASALTTNLLNNIRDFGLMGIHHIFTGPDHMLFIVALLLVSTSFWSLAKTLTGFTIAHSITLILSALDIVSLDNRLVDIFIAGSIIFVGAENIFRADAVKQRFWVAAAFGLIHGFGFSYTLRDIGLPEKGLAWCLASFNIGVEIAQLIICAVTFPLLLLLKKKFDHQAQYGGTSWPKAMHAMSWCVVAMGGYWLLQRVSG